MGDEGLNEPTVMQRRSPHVTDSSPEMVLPASPRVHQGYARWLMLSILCLNICVSYLPYYTFVPIVRQSMQVYSVDESALNLLCITYALVYVPAAFLTGPMVGTLGCRWTFVVAMILSVIGCSLRCGDTAFTGLTMPLRFTSPAFPDFHQEKAIGNTTAEIALEAGVLGRPMALSFWWLVVGQAICALGQPLLVNVTSEMGADWFPPHERPAAAMISNLMNFIGSSLSFILPPFFVEEHSDDLHILEGQVLNLLRAQLWAAVVCLVVTCLVYKQPKAATELGHRGGVSFPAEVLQVLRLRDFWLVTIQFSLFVAIGHAFDAVEGSLLEYYGYGAGLTSWTGLSCAIGSIVSTILEAKLISHASKYRLALVTSNGFIAASMLICFLCLYCRLPGRVFVVAVGIMGLATPAWGCSCELAAEVSYPAREATVSSLLEAVSNLVGVLAIVATQAIIDSGYGSRVFLLMAAAAALGGGSLFCMRGRLYRSEAEDEDAKDDDFGLPVAAEKSKASVKMMWCDAKRMPGVRTLSRQAPCRVVKGWGKYVAFLPLVVSLHVLHAWLTDPTESPALGREGVPVEGPQLAMTRLPPTGLLSFDNRSLHTPQPSYAHAKPEMRPLPTFVIHCPQKNWNISRIRNSLEVNKISFSAAKCSTGTYDEIEEAIRLGLLPPHVLRGQTEVGQRERGLLGDALSHLNVLRSIASGDAPFANVLQSSEVVAANYGPRRAELLQSLAHGLHLINMDSKHPSGLKVKLDRMGKPQKQKKKSWMDGKVFRMTQGLSPMTNEHMSNYIVSKKGARLLLKIAEQYTPYGKWKSFDRFVYSHMYTNGGLVAFSVSANILSVNCAHTYRHKLARLCQR